jgi:hypothetical protein
LRCAGARTIRPVFRGNDLPTPLDQELEKLVAAEIEQLEAYAADAAFELRAPDLASSFLSLVMSQVPAESVTLELDRAGVPHGEAADVRKTPALRVGA